MALCPTATIESHPQRVVCGHCASVRRPMLTEDQHYSGSVLSCPPHSRAIAANARAIDVHANGACGIDALRARRASYRTVKHHPESTHPRQADASARTVETATLRARPTLASARKRYARCMCSMSGAPARKPRAARHVVGKVKPRRWYLSTRFTSLHNRTAIICSSDSVGDANSKACTVGTHLTMPHSIPGSRRYHLPQLEPVGQLVGNGALAHVKAADECRRKL